MDRMQPAFQSPALVQASPMQQGLGMGMSPGRFPNSMLQGSPQVQNSYLLQQHQQYQYQQYMQQQQQPRMQEFRGGPQHRTQGSQQLSDEQFDQVLQKDPQRITLSNDRRFSIDSEIESLSDTSMNHALASKDAFLDYVIKGPGGEEDDDFLDEEELEAKRKRDKKESLVEFLKNTGPEPTPSKQQKKKRGTGIFGFGKKNSNNNIVGNNKGRSGQQKTDIKQQMIERQRQQQQMAMGTTAQQQLQQLNSKKHQPLPVAYDPFSKPSTPPNSHHGGNQQAMMAARNASRRHGGEESRSVQELAQMLVQTGVEEPHPAKYLGHRPRRPESIQMMAAQNPQYAYAQQQQQLAQQQQMGGMGMPNDPYANAMLNQQNAAFQNQQVFAMQAQNAASPRLQQLGTPQMQNSSLTQLVPPVQPGMPGMQPGMQQGVQPGLPPNQMPPQQAQFQPARSSSLDPKISEQLRAMSMQGMLDNNRMSSMNMGLRNSQTFIPAQNPGMRPGQPANMYNPPPNPYANQQVPQQTEYEEYEEDDGYEDMDSDSDIMDEDVLRNTEYNAMIDVGLADVMESDAFIPLRPRKPGPKRNVVFAQFVEEIPDSGDEEDFDEDDLEDEEDEDFREEPKRPNEQFNNAPPPQQQQQQQSAQSAPVQQPQSQGQQQRNMQPLQGESPPSSEPERPAITQRMSSLMHQPPNGIRTSVIAPPPQPEPPAQEKESTPTEQPKSVSQGTDSSDVNTSATASAAASGRSRKKVRHVQIQTRGPPLREIQIQTDPVTFSLPSQSNTTETPPPISERERTLESENEKLSEQCSTLSSQLTDIQSAHQAAVQELEALRERLRIVSGEKEQMVWKLEDDKNKFDKLSQQALKKIRELLNERQVMEIEIDGLRGQVEAFEEQHREWDEEEADDSEALMNKRRSKAMSKRYSELPSMLNGVTA